MMSLLLKNERSDDGELIYDKAQTIRFVVISMLVFLILFIYIVVKVIGLQKIKAFISVNLLKRRAESTATSLVNRNSILMENLRVDASSSSSQA